MSEIWRPGPAFEHARRRRARASAEATIGAVASCALFCDEWEQASHGGELTGAIEDGLVTRDRVTELGAVLAGEAPGRPGDAAVTLFDSTGLAIQDLAVAGAAYDAWCSGRKSSRPRRSRCERTWAWPPVPIWPVSSPRVAVYSGMLPCLRFGPGWRLVCGGVSCSAVMILGRVWWGMITSSR